MDTAARSLICDRVRSQISIQLDGEISQLERAMATSHLERCAACRSYENEVSGFTRVIRQAPHERMENRVVLPRPRRVATGRVRAGVAVAALAIGALVLAGRTSLPESSPPATQPITKRPATFQSQRQLERELAIVHRVRSGSPLRIDGRML